MAYACKEYEAKLEDFLNGGQDPAAAEGLEAHLQRCAGCREALEAARLSRNLLRAAREPAPEPRGTFVTGMIAAIRAEEGKRLAASEFWRPLEALASRLALTAAAALLVLAVYSFEFARPPHPQPIASNQSQVSEGFPEPVPQPTDKDEILLSLAENGHGR